MCGFSPSPRLGYAHLVPLGAFRRPGTVSTVYDGPPEGVMSLIRTSVRKVTLHALGSFPPPDQSSPLKGHCYLTFPTTSRVDRDPCHTPPLRRLVRLGRSGPAINNWVERRGGGLTLRSRKRETSNPSLETSRVWINCYYFEAEISRLHRVTVISVLCTPSREKRTSRRPEGRLPGGA